MIHRHPGFMELAFAVFILLLILMTSANCQQTAETGSIKALLSITRASTMRPFKAYDEAIQARSQTLPMPGTTKALLSIAQGKYDEAIKAYDEAIRLDPNYAAAWNNKGIALYSPGQVQ